MKEQQVATCSEAIAALASMVRDELKPVPEETVQSEFRRLATAWGSRQLFSGTMDHIMPILTTNLERIAGEPGFRFFLVCCNHVEGYAGIMAAFPQAMVPVRIWRGNPGLFLCGNSLFAECRVTLAAAPSLDQQLLSAAKSWDLQKVKSCIKAGADVNTPGLKSTPLIEATHFGAATIVGDVFAVVEVLLNAGANVNATSELDRTALCNAVIHDSRDVAALLIDRGADVNAAGKDMYGFSHRSPLAWACSLKRCALVDLLLVKGATIDMDAVRHVNLWKRDPGLPSEIKQRFGTSMSQAETDKVKKMIAGWSKKWWQFWM